MADTRHYKHLERRLNSNYKQLFVKGVRIRAEVLFGQTVGEDARSPEEVARDYDLPVENVQEAIDYCLKNAAVLAEDHARETANLRTDEGKLPSVMPPQNLPI